MSADMWRVDVAGYPISVRGQPAREHLEQVSRQLSRMKLALHKIKAGCSADPQLDAIRALTQDDAPEDPATLGPDEPHPAGTSHDEWAAYERRVAAEARR